LREEAWLLVELASQFPQAKDGYLPPQPIREQPAYPKDLLEELFPMVALLNTPGRKSESVNKKFVFLLNSSQLPLT